MAQGLEVSSGIMSLNGEDGVAPDTLRSEKLHPKCTEYAKWCLSNDWLLERRHIKAFQYIRLNIVPQYTEVFGSKYLKILDFAAQYQYILNVFEDNFKYQDIFCVSTDIMII